MVGARTVGQAAALASVEGLVGAGVPHALLLSGPAGVGKTTLALDLAASLLCTAAPGERPCRVCRACRMVADGNHPDLHRVAPEGAGGQIRIDQIRALVPALALHAVEGGRRIAILEHADRLNEDAQHALLKTLEEPPGGVTIVLCADDEDRLVPTIRSRVARIRLGLVGVRDIEALLAERGLAQPPESARIARASAGRPGRAVAYAKAPEAFAARMEAARTLVDLVSAPSARRLEVGRELLALASTAAEALERAGGTASNASDQATPKPRGTRGRHGRVPAALTEPGAVEDETADESTTPNTAAQPTATRAPAAERRRGLAWLVELWTDVGRDLVAVALGEPRRLRDPSLLDDIGPLAGRVSTSDAAAFLERLAETSQRLEANVSPELALDVLVLAWPRVARAA